MFSNWSFQSVYQRNHRTQALLPPISKLVHADKGNQPPTESLLFWQVITYTSLPNTGKFSSSDGRYIGEPLPLDTSIAMKSLGLALLICALTGGTIAEQTSRHPRTYGRSQVSRAFTPRKTYRKPEPEVRYVKSPPEIVVKYVEKPVYKEVVKWVEKEVIKYVDRNIIRIQEPEKSPSTYCKEKEGGKCRLGEGAVFKHYIFHPSIFHPIKPIKHHEVQLLLQSSESLFNSSLP